MLALLLSVSVAAAVASVAASGPYPGDLPAPVSSLLLRGQFVGTPAPFRIIALSSVADACAARARSEPAAARACVQRALELARATRPRALDLAAPDTSQGLWLTHLALVLGAGDRTGPCLDGALHARVAVALARRSLAEPLAHVPSYPAVRARWPADQSATLAALHRYDEAHGAHVAAEPLRRYAEVLAAHRASEGLPRSEVAGVTATSHLPRGCALAYTVRYLAEADPARAQALWQRFRERFLIRSPLATGFREWPPGVERPADADSGPIVQGVGAAASAFGIAAARAMGDEPLAKELEATADLVERVGGALSSTIARAAGGTLAAAIRVSARSQPRLTPSP